MGTAKHALSHNQEELAQTLFEEAPDALFLFDPETEQLVDVNPTAQRLTRFTEQEFRSQPVTYWFRSEVPGGLNRLRQAFRTTGFFHSQEGFFLRRQQPGEWIPVNLSITRLHVEPRVLGLIVARDISERKRAEAEQQRAEVALLQAHGDLERRVQERTAELARANDDLKQEISDRMRSEEALRTNEERLARIFETVADGVCLFDREGRITFCNGAAEKISGHPRSKIVGRTYKDLPWELTKPNGETVAEKDLVFARVMRTGTPIHGVERALRRPDGARVIVLNNGAPLRDSLGNIAGVVLSFHDITTRQRAEEMLHKAHHDLERQVVERTAQLRNLASRLSAAEESERRRLALDIHDSIGQMLSVIKLKLETATRIGSRPSSAGDELSVILSSFDEVIQLTRSLTFDLYPAMLDDLGLEATLRWYGDQFASRTGISVLVSETGQAQTLPTAIANYLFRAVKELLTNVVKHAHASEAVLAVHWESGRIRIVVADDGRGFDATGALDPRQYSSLGLISIRERIASLGGQFFVESEPEHGAQVILEVPWEAGGS